MEPDAPSGGEVVIVEPCHVWVNSGSGDMAGLLLMWRRGRKRGWQGWVVSAKGGTAAHGDGPYVWQGWADAAHVRPVK